MTIDLTPIFQAFIALLAAIVTYKLIPWIKSKTTESQQTNLRAMVKVLVFAAEQIYGAGEGKEKLEYVRDRLRENGFDVDIDEIEAAVSEYLNRYNAIKVTQTSEESIELPPVEEWPINALEQLCDELHVPCEWCKTREDYIAALEKGATGPAEEPEKTGETAEAEAPAADESPANGRQITGK